jgi:hypothetical protein
MGKNRGEGGGVRVTSPPSSVGLDYRYIASWWVRLPKLRNSITCAHKQTPEYVEDYLKIKILSQFKLDCHDGYASRLGSSTQVYSTEV